MCGDLSQIEDFGKIYEYFSGLICKKHGITQTAFEIMGFLSSFPNHNTAREICDLRCIKSSIASMTIDKLVKNGYMQRRGDSEDRRIQRLELTQKAEPIVADAKKLHDEFFQSVFADVTEEEKATFFRIIDKMHESVLKTLAERQIKI